MGITVDMFVKTYKANSKTKDKTFEEFIQKHITTTYVDFMTKNVYCDGIIKASSMIKDGDKEFIKINSAARYVFFVMRLIQLYTDIELNNDDIISEYDKLNEVGAISVLMSAIPESEYAEFETILNMKLDDFMTNEYSITALLYNLKQSFNISEEIINSVLEDLKEQNKD